MVDGRSGHAEEAPEVGLGRRLPVDRRVGVDEGEVLSLRRGEYGAADGGGNRHGWPRVLPFQLGSMVVVLPWHQPVRVAEQVAVLDHMSNGRFILGIGRGLGRVEFEGFGVEQEDSRAISAFRLPV